MKKWGLGLWIFICLSLFGAPQTQIVEVNSMPITQHEFSIQTVEAVVPLMVVIARADWLPVNYIDYSPGQTWYMQITVANPTSTAKSFKLEYNLYYGDGAGYYTYRSAASIPASFANTYRINVTSYVAKLGIIRLTGRVYGTGYGLNNKVEAQVYVY